MSCWSREGAPLQLKWKVVAASATTSPVSISSDGVPNRDYLERVIVRAVTTAVGVVTVFDGDTSLLVHNAQAGFLGSNQTVYEIGVFAQTTEGFNITTGSSVSCVAVGIF